MNILFEDNHLLVLCKAAGLLTQDSGTSEINLEDLAKEWIKENRQKPGNVFLHPIHRLDRPVSGIVVFAKTSKALSRMQLAIREKRVKRFYLALVEGEFKSESGTLVHTLVHDHYQAKMSNEGKQCTLFFKVLAKEEKKSLLEVALETGRYHQIRAQLFFSGFPIYGDHKYGAKKAWQGTGIALHHYRFEIDHPIQKIPLIFTAPLPREGWLSETLVPAFYKDT